MARSEAEHQHQVAFVRWARLNTNRFPALRCLHAIPNGGARHIKVAAKMKAEGTLRGVLDMQLPLPNAHCVGLWIEFKVGRNKLTPDQEWFAEVMRLAGHRVAVCYSWLDAVAVTEDYLATVKIKTLPQPIDAFEPVLSSLAV